MGIFVATESNQFVRMAAKKSREKDQKQAQGSYRSLFFLIIRQ